jgi:hypothetical protein
MEKKSEMDRKSEKLKFLALFKEHIQKCRKKKKNDEKWSNNKDKGQNE